MFYSFYATVVLISVPRPQEAVDPRPQDAWGRREDRGCLRGGQGHRDPEPGGALCHILDNILHNITYKVHIKFIDFIKSLLKSLLKFLFKRVSSKESLEKRRFSAGELGELSPQTPGDREGLPASRSRAETCLVSESLLSCEVCAPFAGPVAGVERPGDDRSMAGHGWDMFYTRTSCLNIRNEHLK